MPRAPKAIPSTRRTTLRLSEPGSTGGEGWSRFRSDGREVLVGRYHLAMAHVTKLTKSEVERRRAAAERMRGLFADVAPDRSLVDELIADRRAEAAAESGESAVRRRRGG